MFQIFYTGDSVGMPFDIDEVSIERNGNIWDDHTDFYLGNFLVGKITL